MRESAEDVRRWTIHSVMNNYDIRWKWLRNIPSTYAVSKC